jgi:quercetin dioxygenase-like cupin family protein
MNILITICKKEQIFDKNYRLINLYGAKQYRSSGGQGTFQPEARSACHFHPIGRVLIVTEGEGWVLEWGGAVQVIEALSP